MSKSSRSHPNDHTRWWVVSVLLAGLLLALAVWVYFEIRISQLGSR